MMYIARRTERNERATVKTGNFQLSLLSIFIPPKVPASITTAI